MKSYHITTYGCQMNIHESEKIAGILEAIGYAAVETKETADIIVFNTCCIRDTAEKRAHGNIGALKSAKKDNKDLIIVVCGCMTQQDNAAEDLKKKFPFLDIVLGTSNISLLEDAVNTVLQNRKKSVVSIDASEMPQIEEFQKVYRTSGTNAWLNIMYGCNNFCTYCIVPYVRGRERSRSMSDILAEFSKLLDEGYKEVTLLGQNVNSYGKDLGEDTSFAKLLREIAKFEGKHRVRFMTSHPKDINEEVVDIIAESKNLCNYIHLPIQSGSNKILSLMNRHYTRENYLDLIKMIRAKIPNCGITTDIMVGFPHEDEQDFADTVDIIEKVGYSSAFTFIYSSRKGTKAAEMPQIPYDVKSGRIQKLIKAQNEITKKISRQYEGKVFEVLCEDISVKKENTVCGRTDCGRLVSFEGDKSMIGKFFDVKIIKSKSASLYGKIV